MRRLFVLLCVAAACGPKSTGPAATLGPPPPPAEVIAQAKQTLEQYRQAYEVRSVEALAPLYSQTDDLVVTNQGSTIHGWQAAHDSMAAFCGTMQTVKLRIADTQVVALGGDGAVVTSTVQRIYGDGVKTVDETGTLTIVMRRTPEGWKIVNEHYSHVPVVQ